MQPSIRVQSDLVRTRAFDGVGPRRRRATVAVLIAVAALVVGACSSDDPAVIENDAALPGEEPDVVDDGPAAPGDASLLPGDDGDPSTANEDFEGLRLYPGSEAIGTKAVEDGVVSQSFTAVAEPNVIISHFTNTLEGWEQGAVEDIDQGLRTEFTGPGGRTLEVSASSIDDPDGTLTQYSLVLSG